MSPTPVVGRAVVIVQVRSNNLRRDIRDAVNDGFRDADADIDRRGREVGEHFNESVAKGLRDDERLRIAGERLNLAIAKGMRDDDRLQLDAERHGLRVQDSIAKGMRDEERLRLASDRLNETIANNLARGVREDRKLDLAGQRMSNNLLQGADRALREDRRLDLAGERMANQVHESFSRGLREDRKLDLASEALTERMAARMESAIRENRRLELAGERINQQLADGVRRDRSLDLAMAREARLAAGSFDREHRRGRPQLLNLFGSTGRDVADKLGKEFNLGIGAARMGPAIRSILTLAAPEFLSAAAALGVAAAGVLTAALSSALLSGGLLFAAFKSGAESINPGKEAFGALGTSIGVAIADGMANGFNQSATILTEKFLGPMYPILTRTGELFGNMFTNLANTITLPENMERIGKIFEVNNHFIEMFDTGLQGLTSAFLTLWAASKPMIDLVGERFAEFGQWAATALAAAEANGSLATVMDKLTQLAAGMFDWIAKIGPAFGDWLLNLDVDRILGLWESFGRVIGGVFDIFSEISAGAGAQLPQILGNIADIIGNMVASGTIALFAEHVARLLEAFTGLLAELSDNPVVASVLAFGAAWLLVGGILSPVITLLTALGSALGVAALPIAAVAGALVAIWTQSESFRNAIMGIVDLVGGVFIDIWDELSPKLEKLWVNFLDLASAVGDRLAPVFAVLGPILAAFAEVVGTIVTFVIDQFGELFGFIADVLHGDWEGAWEHAKQIVVNVWNFILDLLGGIGGLIGSIFSGLWDLIVGIWTSIWDTVLDTVKNVGQNLYNAIYDFGNWIKTLWDGLLNWISERWNAMWSGIAEWAAGVWASIQANWEEFKAQLVETGEGLKAWWDNLWAWVFETAANVWNAILGALVAVWNAITSALHFLFDPWISFFGMLWDTIWNGIVSAWNAITSWLSDTWNNITAEASHQWEAFKRETSEMWESIKRGIQDAISDVVGWLADRWEDIKSAASTAWNAVYDYIIEPITRASAKVAEVIQWIKDTVAEALEWLGTKVGEASDKLNEITAKQAEATQALNPLVQAANSPFGPAPSALTALATGGVVNRPTLALVGEAGPERVTPLDADGLSTRDRALITTIVSSMVGRMGSGGSGNTTVLVKIGERTIDDFIASQVDARNDMLARQVSRRRR